MGAARLLGLLVKSNACIKAQSEKKKPHKTMIVHMAAVWTEVHPCDYTLLPLPTTKNIHVNAIKGFLLSQDKHPLNNESSSGHWFGQYSTPKGIL